MERVVHSSLTILEQRIRNLKETTRERMLMLVCDPEAIHSLYVDDVDISCLLGDSSVMDDGTVRSLITAHYRKHPLTYEQFCLREETGSFGDEEEDRIADLNELCERFGNKRFKHGRIQDSKALNNGFVIQETRTQDFELRNKGIVVCDLSSDDAIIELTANWDDPSDPDDEDAFSWQSFLCHPLPPSNSAIIVDRYLFQSSEEYPKAYKWGVNNVVDLLRKIIPNSFNGDYYVTLIFEQDQLGDGIENALNDINYLIRKNLSERLENKQFRLMISFVAVKKPPKGKGPKTEAWKSLHNLIHDRTICTNYYVIDASGTLNVSGKEERASRWQKVQYHAILNGVDNDWQKLKSIPLITERKYLFKLFSFIKAAPSYTYQCYAYDFKEKRVVKCSENRIKNNLISFQTL